MIGLLAAMSIPVAAAPAEKVNVCHYDADTATFHLINVSENAWDAHNAHGDGKIGDPVPGVPGKEFSADCSFETILVTGSTDLLLSGWDCDPSELPKLGTVAWSSDGEQLTVTYTVTGGAANGTYAVGFSYDAVGHPMFVQPATSFPAAIWPYNGNCGGTLSQYLTQFAPLTTDSSGNGTTTVVLDVHPGEYSVQFWLVVGWSPNYQTGGYIGDYETVIIPDYS